VWFLCKQVSSGVAAHSLVLITPKCDTLENNLIPFGKYKGQPVEVLATDKQYLDWLLSQTWFRERYPSINTIIINNFQKPSETPEHNKIQALFLDQEFCKRFCLRSYRYTIATRFPQADASTASIYKIDFENEGADVFIVFEFDGKIMSPYLRVEIKTNLSDDYPAVLRQMKASQSNLLLISNYDGSGATLDQLIRIFGASGINIVLLNEVHP
jgi:hypothetical protein